jgi:polyhydroxybutyrate depolymerase
VGGRSRRYLAYVPKDLAPDAPLLLVLHGSEQQGPGIRAFTAYEFDQLADQRHFAVAYPDGYRRAWNECRLHSSSAAKRENVDDVGFLTALVEQMHAQYRTRADGVWVFGYSNGGQMAYRLAFDKPGWVAALATAGANLPDPSNMSCPTEGPTPPAMLESGTSDPIVPFLGGEVTLFGFASRGRVMSANQTAETFARRNDLTAPPQWGAVGAKVASRTWSKDGRPYLVHYIVDGGGHVVPQPTFRFPRIVGPTNHDLDLPRAAVDFFFTPRP